MGLPKAAVGCRNPACALQLPGQLLSSLDVMFPMGCLGTGFLLPTPTGIHGQLFPPPFCVLGTEDRILCSPAQHSAAELSPTLHFFFSIVISDFETRGLPRLLLILDLAFPCPLPTEQLGLEVSITMPGFILVPFHGWTTYSHVDQHACHQQAAAWSCPAHLQSAQETDPPEGPAPLSSAALPSLRL